MEQGEIYWVDLGESSGQAPAIGIRILLFKTTCLIRAPLIRLSCVHSLQMYKEGYLPAMLP